MIHWIRYRHDIPAPCLKYPGELTVSEVADRFGVQPGVVYYWIQRGHLPARRLQTGKPYWINLDMDKEAELRAWVAHSTRIKPLPTQNCAVSCAI